MLRTCGRQLVAQPIDGTMKRLRRQLRLGICLELPYQLLHLDEHFECHMRRQPHGGGHAESRPHITVDKPPSRPRRQSSSKWMNRSSPQKMSTLGITFDTDARPCQHVRAGERRECAPRVWSWRYIQLRLLRFVSTLELWARGRQSRTSPGRSAYRRRAPRRDHDQGGRLDSSRDQSERPTRGCLPGNA